MARLPRRTHPTIAALRACSWLPATHPIYRLALSTLRDMIASSDGTPDGLAHALNVSPRSARRLAGTFGLTLRRAG